MKSTFCHRLLPRLCRDDDLLLKRRHPTISPLPIHPMMSPPFGFRLEGALPLEGGLLLATATHRAQYCPSRTPLTANEGHNKASLRVIHSFFGLLGWKCMGGGNIGLHDKWTRQSQALSPNAFQSREPLEPRLGERTIPSGPIWVAVEELN